MSVGTAAAIGELMAPRLGFVDPSRFPDEAFDLYSIAAFDSGIPEVEVGGNIRSTKQVVRPGDVLLSGIAPHIRRAWVVNKDRGRRLIASGEWIVFRSEKFYPDYLRHALVADRFYAQFMRTVSGIGGSLLRARPAQITDIEIFLPPLSEQQRIAKLLEQSDHLRRIRHHALELSDAFLPAAFVELFGSLSANDRGWRVVPFKNVCAIDAPLVDPRKTQYRSLPHIGGDSIESVTGRLLNYRTAAEDGLISVKFLIGSEHVLFSRIRPKLRKVSTPNMVALCSADIYPIRAKTGDLNFNYLTSFLRSDYFSRIVSNLAESRTNIPKVNREELADIPVFLPPEKDQRKFASLAQRHEGLLARQREALRQADHLFQTLLHCAFEPAA